MKVNEILSNGKITLSFEVFPPKTDAQFESVRQATIDVAALKPSYMSVTYGAGGSTKGHTIRLAGDIQKKFNVPTIAHLTCVCATKESIEQALSQMKEAGIENILALRGDVPKDFNGNAFTDFSHASDLVKLIKENGDFCVGGACYPEVHPDSASKQADIEGLKKKVEAGCEYLTTQMFFDNHILYNFLYKALSRGIDVPVVAGIMPVTNKAQIKRIVSLSGNMVPPRFLAIVDRFGDNPAAMRQAGIAYATDQIIDLIANGVNHVHIYTMNKPDVAGEILDNLSEIYVRA